MTTPGPSRSSLLAVAVGLVLAVVIVAVLSASPLRASGTAQQVVSGLLIALAAVDGLLLYAVAERWRPAREQRPRLRRKPRRRAHL
jgi:ABC-type nickel/cobalt efflux system permease component RcnA